MKDREPARTRPRPYWDVEAEPPLPWPWAIERLEGARNYWVVLSRPDGRPSARPVWGVWLEGAFLFDSGSMDAKLTADPRVEVHLESGDEVVILVGEAERVRDPETLRSMADAINAKYRWDWKPDGFPAPFRVRPVHAFGWISDPSGLDRGANFGRTGTRWTF